MDNDRLLLVLVLQVAACTVFDGLSFTPDAGDSGGTSPGTRPPGTSRYADAVLADAPIAYWRFEDEGRPTAHDETGRNDCEYVGAVERGVPSVTSTTGTAVAFDGTEGRYVACADAPFDFVGSARFSIEGWIRPRTADTTYRKVVSKDDTEDPRSGYSLSVVAPSLVRVERWAAGAEICGVTAPLSLDVWSHVVATFDGATLRLYVDGVVARDDCNETPLPDLKAALSLGVQADHRYGPFVGAFDEIALYGRALPPERVTAHRDASR